MSPAPPDSAPPFSTFGQLARHFPHPILAAFLRVRPTRLINMLWTIFVILLVLWLLGMVSAYTLGGYIHILLVVAIVVLLIRVIQGRPV